MVIPPATTTQSARPARSRQLPYDRREQQRARRPPRPRRGRARSAACVSSAPKLPTAWRATSSRSWNVCLSASAYDGPPSTPCGDFSMSHHAERPNATISTATRARRAGVPRHARAAAADQQQRRRRARAAAPARASATAPAPRRPPRARPRSTAPLRPLQTQAGGDEAEAAGDLRPGRVEDRRRSRRPSASSRSRPAPGPAPVSTTAAASSAKQISALTSRPARSAAFGLVLHPHRAAREDVGPGRIRAGVGREPLASAAPVGFSTHAADSVGFWSLQPNANTLSSAGTANVRVCFAAHSTVARPAPGSSGASRCSANAFRCSGRGPEDRAVELEAARAERPHVVARARPARRPAGCRTPTPRAGSASPIGEQHRGRQALPVGRRSRRPYCSTCRRRASSSSPPNRSAPAWPGRRSARTSSPARSPRTPRSRSPRPRGARCRRRAPGCGCSRPGWPTTTR